MRSDSATRSLRRSLRPNQRGQMFAIDLALGVLLMTSTLLAVVLFLPDPRPQFGVDAERLETLMTEGVPANWTAGDYIVIGFLSDGRFNTTKIDDFASLSTQAQVTALGIQSSFTIDFWNGTDHLDLCDTCGGAPAAYKQLLPVRRTALMGTSVVTMEVRLYR